MIVNSSKARRGSVLPLLCVLTIFLVIMVALVVDLGYIALTRSELQNAADAAALAGAAQLRGTEGQRQWYQNRGGTNALINYYNRDNPVRQEAQLFGQAHQAGGANVVVDLNVGNNAAGDVVLGYTGSGGGYNLQYNVVPYNTVKVTTYRNSSHAGSLSLFFGPVIGANRADVTATATARYTDAPSNILPITMKYQDYMNLLNDVADPDETDYFTYDADRQPISTTNFTNRILGSQTSPQADGVPEFRLYPRDTGVPANWGTVDLGSLSGSTSDITRQIYTGLNASDWAALQQQGLLTNGQLVATMDAPIQLSGDPGISWSIETPLSAIRGQMRTIPLYTTVVTPGTKAEYTIVGFGNVVVCEATNKNGNKKEVVVQPVMPFKVLSTTGENQLGPVALVR